MCIRDRYTDHFNKIGKNAADTAQLIKTYEANTKGLDAATAFEALEGGRDFNAQSDKSRYDALMQKRSSAKEKAQNHSAGSNISSGSGDVTGPGGNANTQKDIGNTSQTVTQDNDQTSTINGNNNYVNQNQDNSVRNYGGDSRVFNYQGGSGNDSPVSAATMAGYFAPDDSHAANAARLDRQQTQNRDAQKAYQNTSYIAEGAVSRANRNAYIDSNKLDKRISDREQYSRDKAEVMGSNIFGDMMNMNVSWKSAKPQEEVKNPDFNEMYKKYSDFD